MAKIILTSFLLLVLCLSAAIYCVAKLCYPDRVTVTAHKVLDFDLSKRKDLRTELNIGPDNDILLLLTNMQNMEDTKESLDRVIADSHADKINCTLYHFLKGEKRSIEIDQVPGPFLCVQPISGNRYLIVTCSHESPPDGLNAFIYGLDGKVESKLRLGVDVNQMQVDSDGNIWTAYHIRSKTAPDRDALNAGGLDCLDLQGKVLFSYNSATSPQREPAVTDGVSLNVVSPNEVILVPGRDEKVIKLTNKMLTERMSCTFPPTAGIATITDKKVLYTNGAFNEHRISLLDCERKQDHVLNPVDDQGETIDLQACRAACRGSRLYFTGPKAIYYLDIKDLPAGL